MLYIMDRPRLPVRLPRPFGPNEYLWGTFAQDEMRARCDREPYRTPLLAILKRARKAAKLELRSPRMSEAERAHHVLDLAISWWLTGSKTHRMRAAAALDMAGSGHWSSWCAAPEALTDYLWTADLLRPSGGFGRAAEEHFIERIGSKIAEGVAVNDQLPQNNWRLCCLSAVGSAAIAFWHRATPWPVADWLEVAMDGVSRLLYALITPDGAYLEGPGYSRRSLVAFLPFAWTYSSRTDFDLINYEPVRKWLRWLALIAMPDGCNPPVDDTRRERIHPFALQCNARYTEAGLMRWAADRSDPWNRFWAEKALFLYDDSVKPKPPQEPPSQVLEQSGMARFRNDWTNEATYGLLQAKPYPPLGPGQSDSAHRHDDPTNLLVFANGELLTHDAGYGEWGHPKRYSWILTGEAHNMILVNGLGPPRSTYYKGDGSTPNVSTSGGRVTELHRSRHLYVAFAETSYREVDFSRLVAFVGGRYFVVLDMVDGAASHTYSWTLHGAGKLVRLSHERVLWRTRTSQLDVRWLLPVDLQVTRHEGMHIEARGAAPHEYVKASVTAKRTAYLTVMLPGVSGEETPEIARMSLANGAIGVSVRSGTEADHFVFSPWNALKRVALPGGKFYRLNGMWAAFLERRGRVLCLRPNRAPVRSADTVPGR
jgi:hypothetical protein